MRPEPAKGIPTDGRVGSTRRRVGCVKGARFRIGYFRWSRQEESDGGHSEAESVA